MSADKSYLRRYVVDLDADEELGVAVVEDVIGLAIDDGGAAVGPMSAL